MLVAGAILCAVVSGFYAAFLRVNDYAASSRCNSAAKVLLEQAANIAQTADWDSIIEKTNSRPTILTPTVTSLAAANDLTQGWQVYDLNPQYANGVASLADVLIQDGRSKDSTGATRAYTPTGMVLLFTDPNQPLYVTNSGTRTLNESAVNIYGTLSRKVFEIDSSKTLLRVCFRIDYVFHGRTMPPVYLYTMRARND